MAIFGSLSNWLPGIFFSYLLLYKYTALFLIAFAAALILPVPASTMLVAAGAFAYQGYLNIGYILLVALSANIAGDATGYLLARYYGEEVLAKIGFRRFLKSNSYAKFKDYMLEYPQSIIYFSRFLTEIGPAVNLLSGLAKVPYKTYFFFEVLGEACYVLLYGAVGYFLGSQWENNLGFFTKAGFIIFGLGLTINLIQVVLYKKRNRSKNTRH